jgi:hypothetical protein
MTYFIQANEYDMIMHANIQYDNHAWMFVNNFLGIFKRITLYFSEFSTNVFEFWMFELIS